MQSSLTLSEQDIYSYGYSNGAKTGSSCKQLDRYLNVRSGQLGLHHFASSEEGDRRYSTTLPVLFFTILLIMLSQDNRTVLSPMFFFFFLISQAHPLQKPTFQSVDRVIPYQIHQLQQACLIASTLSAPQGTIEEPGRTIHAGRRSLPHVCRKSWFVGSHGNHGETSTFPLGDE